MAIRPSNTCCGNEAGLVDKFIGTAYDVVKTVYDNLDAILAVAGDLDKIDAVYDNLDDLLYLTYLAQTEGLMITVKSEAELTALDSAKVKYGRIYTNDSSGYSYVDYAFVEGVTNGIPAHDSTTGSWVAIGSSTGVITMNSIAVPYTLATGQTSFTLNEDALGVSAIYLNGQRQHPDLEFHYDSVTKVVTLADAIDEDDNHTIIVIAAGVTIEGNNTLQDYLKSNQGASIIGTESGLTVQESLDSKVDSSTLSKRVGSVLYMADYGIGLGGDDTSKILAAVADANAIGAELIAPYKSVITISGSTSINFQYSVDWNNSRINHDSFTGRINIQRPTELAVRTLAYSSPEIQAIRDKGEVIWGGVINAWANNTSLQNYYIVIKTNTPFFHYRSVMYNMTLRNRLYRGGALAHEFDYPITPTSIQSIDLYPVPDTVTEFKNATFHKASDPKDLILVSHSRIKLENIHFSHDGGLVTTGMIYVSANDCYDMEWSNLTAPFGQRYLTNPTDPSTIQASYVFRIGDSYECHLHDLHANGLEWGTIGTDEVTNCLVERCVLARYDSHRPFHGFLHIKNSIIGARGISVQGTGSMMLLDTVKFINNSINDYTPNNGLPFFINSRGDAGGFVDCDLVTINCTFVNNLSLSVNVVAQTWGPSFSDGVPAGSPIRNVSFRTITHTKPIVKTIPGDDASRIDFGVREASTGTTAGYTPTGSNTPDLPFTIVLNDIKSREGGLARFETTCTRPASSGRATAITSATPSALDMVTNTELIINDCVLLDKDTAITLVDTTGTYSARVNLNGYRAMSDLFAVTMRLFMPVVFKAVSSRIREIRPFYNSVTLDKPMEFEFSACDLYPPDAFISWLTTATNRSANLNGCTIMADTMLTLTKMAAYKLSGCRYILKGTGYVQVPITESLLGASANFLSVAWMTTENIYRINGSEGDWYIRIPEPANDIRLDMGYVSDFTVQKQLIIYRSSGGGGALRLTKSTQDPMPTYIYLP